MTLDEAIKHAEEVAQDKWYEYQDCLEAHDMESANECVECGNEHEQLAEWLKELRDRRMKTGAWIDADMPIGYYANCSECGYQIDVHENRGYPNYCEHCGARMDGDVE